MKYCFFPHPSSKNHGCEAIAISSFNILKRYLPDAKTEILTKYSADSSLRGEKNAYVLYDKEALLPLPALKRYSLPWFKYCIGKCLQKDIALDLITEELLKKHSDLFSENDVFVSIGGDNYCYGRPTAFYAINRAAHETGKKTVLWGCSIEPNAINNEMLKDLKMYDKIVARESLTYNALLDSGLKNTVLYPDPAFTLMPVNSEISLKNTIGINVSPMIMDYSSDSSVVFEAFKALIKYICEKTNFDIALIPHVTAASTNDLDTLKALKYSFDTDKRVCLYNDMDCQKLKHIISQCRFFIGARTHATIAAYSTCVPTLVCGYSVKAKGIAKDLFGEYENYVIPVQEISNEKDLIRAFEYILYNEEKIRSHLEKNMPNYVNRAWAAGKELYDVVQK